MVFKTTGNKSNSVILFFHAMGVTGESSMPVAEKMAEKYYCIMPTSTVYCSGQRYQSKRDEIQQIVRFLGNHDSACCLSNLCKLPAIKKNMLYRYFYLCQECHGEICSNRRCNYKFYFFDSMVPFLYIAMKSLYWSKGKTLKRIMWCDDDKIKPYFIEAGKNLTYGNLRRQLTDSLEDKPFPELSEELQ